MLEVAGESACRTRVSPECYGGASILEDYHVLHCLNERNSVRRTGGTRQGTFHISRFTQSLDFILVRILCEKLVVKKSWSCAVDICAHFTSKSWDIADATFEKTIYELLIHVRVPYGVRDHPSSHIDQALGVFKVEQMCGDPESSFVPDVHHSLDGIPGHFTGRAKIVIYPELEPINTCICISERLIAGCLWSIASDYRSSR